jgi:L-iditol 2-dehydrogenase
MLIAMRVARLHGRRDVRLHDEALPSVAAGESLVHVRAVGQCGSDQHWYDEGGIGDARQSRALVLGHEFVGVVGEDRRVIADPAVPCGACTLCLEGQPNLCPSVRFAGHGAEDGALREQMAWPSHCLHPLPDGLDDAEATLLEPLGVAIHAVDLAHVHVGARVAVLGGGPVGLLVMQVARAAGACRVVATELGSRPWRVAAASRYVQAVIEADEMRECSAVRAELGGLGADVVIETAGENAAVEVALDVARPGGRVVLVGIPASDRTSFSAGVARRKGLTIALARRMKPVYGRALDLVRSGQVDLGGIVTHRFPLEQCDEAFRVAVARTGLKVVIATGMLEGRRRAGSAA